MSSEERQRDYNFECRDPVHGFVYLSKAEWAIVDCPAFQRLRDIRQLAMAHLVYPGAIHTRFEHSLGCLHLSNLIYSSIRRHVKQKEAPNFARAFWADKEQEDRGLSVLRLASMLNDIGHTPFSPSGENLMPEEVLDGKKRRIDHEEMTARLIRESEIAEILEKEFDEAIIEEIIAVATKPELARLPEKSDKAWYRFLNEILTGELGSDRMDYLLRDATHSGQSAGLFDHRKLIDSMTIVPPPKETGEAHRLGLDGAGWLVGEQMVAARYLMYVALYFHKTKRIYEIHLERFLAKWLETKYSQPHFPTFDLKKYVSLTDSPVWAAIYKAVDEGGELQVLARPFVDRSHLRLAHELLPADNFVIPTAITGNQGSKDGDREAATRRSRVWNAERFDSLKNAVYDYVREEFGEASDDVLAYDETKHHAAKFFGSKDKIWVFLDGKTRYLDDLSEIVSGMPDKIWRGRIYVKKSYKTLVKSFCEQWLIKHPLRRGETDGAVAS